MAIMTVIGWVLWAAVLLYALGVLSSRNPDGGVRSMMRTQGLVLLASCFATAVTPISKFWLLAALPVAFYLPTVLMMFRVRTAGGRLLEQMRSDGQVLLRDTEWECIDGQHCLVTEFTPMATMENGEVKAVDQTTPYASVRLRGERSSDEIAGFITHKLDFAMLWAAFNERTDIPGVHAEVEYADVASRPGFCENSNLATRGGGSNEEVHLEWTRRRYKTGVSAFQLLGLPKLIVSVHPKGAFDVLVQQDSCPELTGLTGEARFKVLHRLVGSLVTMTPEVMYE